MVIRRISYEYHVKRKCKMQNTIKALADLRAHWKSEGCPPIAPIAKKANIPSATANRYITGTTKGGTAETIRALAIAIGRPDIAESVPYTSLANVGQDYIAEMVQQWQEKTQQQIADTAARHKQEMDDLMRDHRAERESWREQCKAMHEENANLRESFDRVIKIQHREKWISYALFLLAVAALLLK